MTRDEAIEAVRVGGRSTRDVARDAGVSHVTIARWVKAAEAGEAPRRAPRRPKSKGASHAGGRRKPARGESRPGPDTQDTVTTEPAGARAQHAPGAPAISARAAALAERMRAPEPDDEPDEFAGIDEADSLAYARAMRARSLRLVRDAERVGNHTAAARALRDAGAQAILIARLERAAAQESDVLRISRAQIDEAIAGVYARVAAMLDRPLHCAKCARELSVEWGTAGTNRATDKA